MTEKLLSLCKEYINKPNCVFITSAYYMIVMEKLTDPNDFSSIQECHANVVDKKYAKFKADKLRVLFIVDVQDVAHPSDAPPYNNINKTPQSITDYYDIRYTIGEIARPIGLVAATSRWFNSQANPVGELHYYESIEAAYTNNQRKPSYDHTGKWTTWYDSGQVESDGYVTKGVKMDRWTEWYELGLSQDASLAIIKSIGRYKRNLQTGFWLYFYENGKMQSCGNYTSSEKVARSSYGRTRDQIKVGRWKYWYDNGQLKAVGNHNDKQIVADGDPEGCFADPEGCFADPEGCFADYDRRKNGKWTEWYDNGIMKSRGCYKDNYRVGFWKFWSDDAQLEIEGFYKYGMFENESKQDLIKIKYNDPKLYEGW